MSAIFSRRDFVKVSALAALCSGPATQASDPSNRPPNVVVILSDEFNFPSIGFFGGNPFSPNLDKLAAAGARLDAAYCASPVCTASRYSVLTGQFPGRCTHPKFLETQPLTDIPVIAWNTYIHEGSTTVPRWLAQNGYFTAMSGKWHVGGAAEWLHLPAVSPDADPADEMVSAVLEERQKRQVEVVKKTGGFDFAASVLFENYPEEPVKKLRYHNNEWLAAGALRCLEAAGASGKPFYLYLTPTEIHGPSMVNSMDQDPHLTVGGIMKNLPAGYPSRADEKHRLSKAGPEMNREDVAGMIMLDDYVGFVLRKLDELGVADNTLVIFAADHNIEPGKGSCYDWGLHSVSAMRWPGHIPAGIKSSAAIQYTDFAPTIYAACQVPNPSGVKLDGANCLPALLTGHPTVTEREMYFEFGLHRAVRAGNFKYIAFRYPQWAIKKMESGETDVALDHNGLPAQAHASITMRYYPHFFDQDQLYDLEQDPYEQHNLAELPEYAGKLAEMKDRLAKNLATFAHPYPLSDQPFMRSEPFKKLVEARKAKGTTAKWWRDIPWPPEGTVPVFCH